MPDMPPPAAGPRAVNARHAASLLVLGQGGDGRTVLMGMRGAGHRFMPNRLVFPGGAVDRADLRTAPAAPMPSETRAALERSANPALASALGVAAARELTEETGLTLGDPPALDGLRYLCRAVTPPGQPIRFNARFLIIDGDRVSGSLAGSGELEGLRFYPLNEALALDLAWVTRKVLEHLTDWLAMPPVARSEQARWPVCRNKRWTRE